MARLSRRNIVAGIATAPLLGTSAAARTTALSDPVLVLCAYYADLHRRQDSLMRRWGDVEAWLGVHRDWFKLSDEAQRAVPEGRQLRAIDDELERLGKESVRTMRRLRTVPACTLEGSIAKLSVVADVIEPDDYPSAHRVLLSAIADLRLIRAAR